MSTANIIVLKNYKGSDEIINLVKENMGDL